MDSFRGILIVSDIDGTLLGPDHRLSHENLAAIRRFQSKGGRFTLATGRMPSSTAQFLTELRVDCPLICYNGASIHDPCTDRTLWERHLDPGMGDWLALVDREFPESGIEVYQGRSIHFCKINPLVRKHCAIEGFRFVPEAWKDIPEPWTKIILVQKQGRTEVLKDVLSRTDIARHCEVVQSSSEYLELLPKGASKGQALLELCRITGQDPARTIAAGDNENDIDMLRKAGIGVAVANAPAGVKAAARHVTVSHGDHAIAAIIEGLESGTLGFSQGGPYTPGKGGLQTAPLPSAGPGPARVPPESRTHKE